MSLGRRPRCHRQELRNIVYVGLTQTNGGILRNVSEAGAAIQMLAAPKIGQTISLRFEMLNPRARIETRGRVMWTDALGLAGVQFSEMTPSSRRLLKEWIFTQLLASAERDCSSAMFSSAGLTQTVEGLSFSQQALPAIKLETNRRISRASRELGMLRFSWWPFEVAANRFSRWIDGLILACAVLLFTFTSLLTMSALPTWPLGLALVAGAAAAFVAAYWLIFSFLSGMTPGQHLAKLAAASGHNMDQDLPRFR